MSDVLGCWLASEEEEAQGRRKLGRGQVGKRGQGLGVEEKGKAVS